MIKQITFITLLIFDHFHKKKIINFVKKKLDIYSINILLDIGAHKGESIDFFSKNLNVKKIISFEASPNNFEILKKKYRNKKNLIIENKALSSKEAEKIFNQCDESSSSTFSEINENSKYLKKKMGFLNISKVDNFFKKQVIKTTTLDKYLYVNNILTVDLIKIDTEGHEFEVLKGLKTNIKNVNTIIFEHHYDNMIKKKYTFSDIHNFLKQNSFIKVFKVKMPFRKSFEYIYVKNK